MAAAFLNNEHRTAKANPACDIWSLGCVLYQLITQRRLLEDLVPSDKWRDGELLNRRDDALRVRTCAMTAAVRRTPCFCSSSELACTH